jgi:ubiquinone/menaquinone biosynthesis C-methylase UbiE
MAAQMSGAARRADDVYVMGRTNDEYDRLRLQAQLLEPVTAAVLEKAGLRTGFACLDVGCGPGEVMRLMAERVGPTGSVVGLDVDRDLGEKSVSALVKRGLRQCSFVEGDVRNLAHIRGEPFDLVYERLFLVHQTDPVGALQKMYSWVKPGGVIVTQEYYFGSLDSHPQTEALDKLKNLFYGTCRASGKDPFTALRVPQYFVEAGIGLPDGTDVSGHFLPREPSFRMVATAYRSVLP